MTSTIEEYWRSTLRPDHLARRRAMVRALQLQTLPGILAFVAASAQPPAHDALNTPVLPAHEPTGILS